MGFQEGMLLCCTTEATNSNGKVTEVMIEPRIAMSNVFIDPTEAHVLISMENGSNFYLHTGSARPKKIMKAPTLQTTSVAWDYQSETFEPVLIGTDSGAVFQAEFDGGKEKSYKMCIKSQNRTYCRYYF